MKNKPNHRQTNRRTITSRNRLFGLFAAVSTLACGSAICRAADYTPGSPPPAKTAPGRVGIAYGGSLPEFDLQIPDTRGEAAQERAVQLGLWWERDLEEGRVRNELDALGIYLGMGLTPLGALAGGSSGAFAGESARKLTPALTIITNVMAELDVQEALRRQLPLLLREKSPQPVVLMTKVNVWALISSPACGQRMSNSVKARPACSLACPSATSSCQPL